MADQGEMKRCSNCKRDISSSNFVMHEMHCRRHIVLCDHCQEPIPRSELEQHFNDVHAKTPCVLCKMEVAKENMEKHMENDCAKKPMHCQFCELSFPKADLASHFDYCGSRTECCPLCQQYIMLKDMVQHENSGCSYPEPKPAAAPASSNTDPFRMEELHYMLDAHDFGSRDMFPDVTSNLRRELNRNRAAEPEASARPSAASGNKPSLSNARRAKNSTSKKSDVNVQRARNLVPIESSEDDWKSSIPPDMDYDTMLALQLAHEDWQEDLTPTVRDDRQQIDNRFNMADFRWERGEENIPDFQRNIQTQEPSRQNAGQAYEDEDMSIPCEFCEMEIPLTTYLEHVETCPLGESASDNRNNESTSTQPHTRASIPVINNLRADESAYSDVGAPLTLDDLDEQVVLPCEFCEEVFPSDIIFQHQNVCQANMSASRATTPASVSRNLNTKPPSNPTSFKPKSKPKRQLDPAPIDFVDNDDDDGMVAHARGRNQGASEGLNYFRFRKVSDSPTDKYKPPVNRFDDAMARPPRRPSRQLEEEVEIPTSNGLTDRRPSKSAQRARARLNQLLQEDTANGATSGATAGTRKTPKPLGVVDKNQPGTRDRKTHVTSRTVMNQLDRAGQRPSRNRSEDNPSSQAPAGRHRQRADHVFSPELRLKPDHNPPPKKR
ncbi:TRAF-type zinc finger domain-containing protein 1 [Aplysia californica]|uniref:TRAF-type zinc finger domain-containing protein 1 n=1 Tax=Aplysia californica TaxID=6500 RepID=A0ABM0K4K9_APLCA|nr:TRAF-type zinc finger domain-containing protein 1 [Aplysia californica]